MWKILREEVFMKNSNRKGYQIDDAELQKIQEIQKELIAEVDRICKKCGIHYNMERCLEQSGMVIIFRGMMMQI